MKKIIPFIILVIIALHSKSQEFVEKMDNPNANFYETQQAFYDYFEGKPYEKGKGFRQFKRWEWFMEQRVYPSGNKFSSTSAWTNFMDYKKVHQADFSLNKSANWAPLGPTSWQTVSYNPGLGRVNVIVMDPNDTNKIYIGVPSGGFWKSADGGNTWAVTTDNLPVLGVSGIGIDPNDSQTIYIATGDGDGSNTYSIGVLKSTDGGNNWTTTGLGFTISQSIRPTKILMHPTNSNKLWVATSNGLYYSTDKAVTFTRVLTGFIRDLEMNPVDTTILYAASTSFFKSTDGGLNFNSITTGLPNSSSVNRMSIAVTPDDPSVVYGLYGNNADASFYGIYRSLDTGKTFVLRTNTPNFFGYDKLGTDTRGQSWYDMALAVSPTNKDEVYIGGVNVWKSLNGGSNFSIMSHWTFPSTVGYTHADIHTLDYYNGKIFCGSDGGIYKSNNNDSNWVNLSFNLGITQFYRMGSSEINPELVAAGAQDNGCNLRQDSANNWLHIFGADGMECAILPSNPDVIFFESQNGGLRRSTNGGLSATYIAGTIKNQENGAWVTPYQLDKNNQDRIVAAYENIWLSNNLGNSWAKISNFPGGPTFRSLEIAPSNSNTIYAATLNSIFKTNNLGNNWIDITKGIPNLSITYIEVDENDDKKVWLTLSGFNTGNKVYYSNNGGSSWTNISYNLPNLPANCIEQDKRNGVLYVGTDVGIYYLKPYTFDWLPYMNGLPNVIVNELEMNYSANKLRAATYGRGIWESNPFVYPTNVPIARFETSNRVVCPNVTVQFTDQSLNNITSYQWNFPGGNPSTSTLANPAITYPNQGNYDVTLIVSDGTNSDTLSFTNYIDVQLPSLENIPYLENLDIINFPRNPNPKYAIINPDGDNTWEHFFSIPALSYMVYIDNFNASPNRSDILEFPSFNFDSIIQPSLFFNIAYTGKDLNSSDTLKFYYSIDCGNTKVEFAELSGANLRSLAPQNGQYAPASANDFINKSIPINGAGNNSVVKLYIENISANGNVLYLDNFEIKEIYTSIKENINTDFNFSIYPNPSKGIINVEWKNMLNETTFEIYDVIGNVITSRKVERNQGNFSLDLSNQAKGVYFIKSTNLTDQKLQKIIIQ